ncbi:MAG: hypothetical protein RL653_974 [Pseudomonadota bacterium]|jgi:XRE family aerobic/anaerobic benzoate catabolism transcriptional regulator
MGRTTLDRTARHLGRRVAELRRRAGMTQEELAEQVDTSTRYVQQVEAGRQNLTLELMVRFANGLEVDPAALLQPLEGPPAQRLPGRPPRSSPPPRGR